MSAKAKLVRRYIRRARLRQAPKRGLQRHFPDEEKQALAFKWLYDNPTESANTAAKINSLKQPGSLQRKWKRHQEKVSIGARIQPPGSSGHNKILDDAQERALIRFAVDHSLDGRKGATRLLLFQYVCHMRKESKKSPPTWR
ncbi:uncharacterized protein RAG0_03056 [Rhynchosporium agropyri]|uniref:Uncharacterized protein n=1 Tax=Rhynchosporium agropyri TaxID=914238 RepID=A0A1E1K2Y2_9HELO|nr:uncharacterized protein RAG0_03056 [Rhynchosporium agropyri]